MLTTINTLFSTNNFGSFLLLITGLISTIVLVYRTSKTKNIFTISDLIIYFLSGIIPAFLLSKHSIISGWLSVVIIIILTPIIRNCLRYK
jgi:hypothetical protein